MFTFRPYFTRICNSGSQMGTRGCGFLVRLRDDDRISCENASIANPTITDLTAGARDQTTARLMLHFGAFLDLGE